MGVMMKDHQVISAASCVKYRDCSVQSRRDERFRKVCLVISVELRRSEEEHRFQTAASRRTEFSTEQNLGPETGVRIISLIITFVIIRSLSS